MAILRKVKNENYVVVDKVFVNDDRLSWKAKGIMIYLLSLPDDWKFYVEELVTHAKDGEKAFRSGFKELEKYGYVKRFPVRDGNRIVEWDTTVYENPVLGENGDIQKDALLSNNNKLSNKELSNDISFNAMDGY
jgi:predicted transcriptional regulator